MEVEDKTGLWGGGDNAPCISSVYGPRIKWLLIFHIFTKQLKPWPRLLLCTALSWCLTRFQTHPPPLQLITIIYKSDLLDLFNSG